MEKWVNVVRQVVKVAGDSWRIHLPQAGMQGPAGFTTMVALFGITKLGTLELAFPRSARTPQMEVFLWNISPRTRHHHGILVHLNLRPDSWRIST